MLFPGFLLGGLHMSRTKLISKLYSGLLQTSTFCHFRNTLSSKLYVSFNSGYSQTVCQKGAFSHAFAGVQETACVCCCKSRQRMRRKDMEKDPLFLFTQRTGVENILFALCSEKFCEDLEQDWLFHKLFLVD